MPRLTARIEEHRVAGAIVVPEVRVEWKERVRHFLPAIVEQHDVVVAAPPIHRRREVQGHSELIGGNSRAARIEVRDDVGWLAVMGGPADDRGQLLRPPRDGVRDCRQSAGIEDHVLVPAALIEREHRCESDSAGSNRVFPCDRWCRIGTAFDGNAEERGRVPVGPIAAC